MGSRDVVVVGGGPAGYPVAGVLAREGYNVTLIEADKLGGECTNYGCVPTKSLLHTALTLADSRKLGFSLGEFKVWSAFQNALSVASALSDGIRSVLARSGVELVEGYGKVLPSGAVEVDGERIEAGKGVILATGSEPFIPPGVRVDGVRIHDNRSILGWEPDDSQSVIVVGGGYVGIEYSTILSLLGYRVTIIEAMNRLLPGMDRDFSLLARRILAKLGVRVVLSSPVSQVRSEGDGVRVLAGDKTVRGDLALVAIGRKPRNTEALRAGLPVNNKGFVAVGDCWRALGKFYAVGDIAGPPLLAHKAIHESIGLALCLKGDQVERGQIVIPQVVYGLVDFVSVGMTLEEASRRGVNAVEVRVPAGGLARPRIHGVSDGFAKIVYDEGSRRILGIHLAYPNASETAPAALLLVNRHTLSSALEVVFPHPTFGEVLQEVILASLGLHAHVSGVRVRRARKAG